MSNIKYVYLVPTEPRYEQGRKVVHVKCIATEDDIREQNERLSNSLPDKQKKVIRIGPGHRQVEYKSIAEASLQTGSSKSAISKCCNGKQQTSYGYKFKFKDTT